MVVLPVTAFFFTLFNNGDNPKRANPNCGYRFDILCYDEKEAKERLIKLKLKEVGASNTDLLNFW